VKISADGLLNDLHGSSDYRANLVKVIECMMAGDG
jgi:hypothetical protein